MKHRIFGAAAVGCLLALGGPAASAQEQPPAAEAPAAPIADPVVAVVDSQEFRLSDVLESARSLPPQYQQQIGELLPLLIDRLVDFHLLTAEARRRNLQDDAAVQAEVARYEDQVVRQTLLNRYLDETIDDASIQARYDRFAADTPPQVEVRARHILVASEDEAKAVIDKLDQGADFVELAKTDSIEPGAAERGGDVGYFLADGMLPEFSVAAFALAVGEVSKAPVQSQYGWHVIRVEDRRDAPPPTLEAAREEIVNEMTQEQIQTFLAELRAAAEIEKFNPDGSPIAAAASDAPAP
ncbi:MAG: peptidylprolyl isomerase [Dongiaceae bacterium]